MVLPSHRKLKACYDHSLPVAHPVRIDVAFKGDGSGRHDRSAHPNAVKAQFAPVRIPRSRVQLAVAVQNVGAAQHPRRTHLIHLLKTPERALELGRTELPAQTDLSPHVLQGSLLPRTNPRCRAGTHIGWSRGSSRTARRTARS